MTSSSITLFSGLAVKDILEKSVLPAFISEYGCDVNATFDPTTMLLKRIEGGASPDVVLGVGHALQRLAGAGFLASETLSPLVRSGIGVAVPLGSAPPSIQTVEELIAAIRGARSVAYSRTGASGAHFADLLDRFDIAAEVNARACILDGGFTAEALVDGRADLAVQQLSELASVAGVNVVGPLPKGAQHYVELWVGASVEARTRARDLLRCLTSPATLRAFEAGGLEAAVGQNKTALQGL